MSASRTGLPTRTGGTIRIALVHSFYRSGLPSGENAVVGHQAGALRRAGFDVEVFAARTDDMERSPLYPVGSVLRVATGRGRSPLREIRRFDPDVVHVHNLFPNFGRRWVSKLLVPVVATIHNYRPLCVNGLLFRDGAVCTLCPDGKPWSGVRFGCYRGSRLASAPLAWANRKGPSSDPLLARADRVVVLSEMARVFFTRAGLDAGRTVVWPNFLPADMAPPVAEADGAREGWLFVGRLSPEKGILRLVEAWPADRPLRIIGDGPDGAAVRRAASGKRVDVMGLMDRQAVLDAMGASRGLVFPSLWFEAFPMVYAEALALGLPVLAWRPSVLADHVGRDGTGAATGWGEDLISILESAEHRFRAIHAHCREVFEREFSEPAFVARATSLFTEIIAPVQRSGEDPAVRSSEPLAGRSIR